MRVLIVTGIFPPDIGGPATHAADLRAELTDRGHDVTVLTLTDAHRTARHDNVVRFPRSWGWPLRSARMLLWVARNGRRFDVCYATGLGPVAVAGARLSGRPVILKIVGDPAWERAVRRQFTAESFDDFQESRAGGRRLRAMRSLRNWSTRHVSVVVTPSEYLARAVRRWAPRDDVVVVPNGVRTAATDSTARSSHDDEVRVVFVGRLVGHKRVDMLIEAASRGSPTRLEIIGDGPEFERLRALARRLGVEGRVSFAGALPHDEVMQRLGASDAVALASSYEGLPHVILEALVSGTPVVTSAESGLGELLTDGSDAIVFPEATVDAFADAFARLAADPELLRHLRVGAAAAGTSWSLETCADRLEGLMREVSVTRPRAVFVGKHAVSLPPTHDDEEKYRIHQRYLFTEVVCVSTGARVAKLPGARFVAVPDVRPALLGSIAFYTCGPLVAVALAAGRHRSAIVCQSPYEGFGVALLRTVLPPRMRPRLQIELHGDWRTASRTYGSPRRRLLGPLADRVAVWSLRRADRVRVVSEWLGGVAREAGYVGPIDRFVAFSDYSTFLDASPVEPPEQPEVLFAGALERHKALDVLLDAWVDVVRKISAARLTIVGTGSLADELQRQVERAGLASCVAFLGSVPRDELRVLLDRSSCLVLPSRSEGLGRVVLEAMARARPVVASRVGGVVELVEDGRTGYLVRPDDAPDLARAITDVLCDIARAERFGLEARRRALERDPLREYEAGVSRLAVWIDAS